jgi:hypothetical protein
MVRSGFFGRLHQGSLLLEPGAGFFRAELFAGRIKNTI